MMITVFRAGAFTDGNEPQWRIAAREYAHPSNLDWPQAVSDELDRECNRITLRGGAIHEAAVI